MSLAHYIMPALHAAQTGIAANTFYYLCLTATAVLTALDTPAEQGDAANSRLWKTRRTLAGVAATILLSIVITTNLTFTYNPVRSAPLIETIAAAIVGLTVMFLHTDVSFWSESLQTKIVAPGNKHGIGAFDPVAVMSAGLAWLMGSWFVVTIGYLLRLLGVFDYKKVST